MADKWVDIPPPTTTRKKSSGKGKWVDIPPPKEEEHSFLGDMFTLPNIIRFGGATAGALLAPETGGLSLGIPFAAGALAETVGRKMEGKPFNPVVSGVEGALNLIPGGKALEEAGVKALAKHVARSAGHGAFQGAAGSIPRHIAETGKWELPSLGEAAQQTIGGAVIGGGVGAVHGSYKNVRGIPPKIKPSSEIPPIHPVKEQTQIPLFDLEPPPSPPPPEPFTPLETWYGREDTDPYTPFRDAHEAHQQSLIEGTEPRDTWGDINWHNAPSTESRTTPPTIEPPVTQTPNPRTEPPTPLSGPQSDGLPNEIPLPTADRATVEYLRSRGFGPSNRRSPEGYLLYVRPEGTHPPLPTVDEPVTATGNSVREGQDIVIGPEENLSSEQLSNLRRAGYALSNLTRDGFKIFKKLLNEEEGSVGIEWAHKLVDRMRGVNRNQVDAEVRPSEQLNVPEEGGLDIAPFRQSHLSGSSEELPPVQFYPEGPTVEQSRAAEPQGFEPLVESPLPPSGQYQHFAPEDIESMNRAASGESPREQSAESQAATRPFNPDDPWGTRHLPTPDEGVAPGESYQFEQHREPPIIQFNRDLDEMISHNRFVNEGGRISPTGHFGLMSRMANLLRDTSNPTQARLNLNEIERRIDRAHDDPGTNSDIVHALERLRVIARDQVRGLPSTPQQDLEATWDTLDPDENWTNGPTLPNEPTPLRNAIMDLIDNYTEMPVHDFNDRHENIVQRINNEQHPMAAQDHYTELHAAVQTARDHGATPQVINTLENFESLAERRVDYLSGADQLSASTTGTSDWMTARTNDLNAQAQRGPVGSDLWDRYGTDSWHEPYYDNYRSLSEADRNFNNQQGLPLDQYGRTVGTHKRPSFIERTQREAEELAELPETDPNQMDLNFKNRLGIETEPSYFKNMARKLKGAHPAPSISHRYAASELANVPHGDPGLESVRSSPLKRGENPVRSQGSWKLIYRDENGIPVAKAEVNTYHHGNNGVWTLAADENNPAYGNSVKAIGMELIRLNALRPIGSYSNHTKNLILRLENMSTGKGFGQGGRAGRASRGAETPADRIYARQRAERLAQREREGNPNDAARRSLLDSFIEDESGTFDPAELMKNLNDLVSPTAKRWAKKVLSLTRRNAPDEAYRSIGQSGERPLREGETYRDRAMRAIDFIESRTDRDPNQRVDQQLLDHIRNEGRVGPTDNPQTPETIDINDVLNEARSAKDPSKPTPADTSEITQLRQEYTALRAEQDRLSEQNYDDYGPEGMQYDQPELDEVSRRLNEVVESLGQFDRQSNQGLMSRLWNDDQGAVPISDIGNMWNTAKEKMGWGQGGEEPPRVKGEGNLLKEILNFPSSITTTGDLSAAGRQGLSQVMTPEFWSAFKQQFSGARSRERFDEIDADLRAKPIFHRPVDPTTKKVGKSIADIAGVKLMEPPDKIGPKEEGVASKWVEQIPGFGRYFAGSNRAYITFLNHLRANRLEKLLNNARDMSMEGLSTGKVKDTMFGQFGPSRSVTPEEALNLNPYKNTVLAKEIGDFINTATGRGPLKMHLLPYNKAQLNLEGSAKALSYVLFSPRLLASRMRMLNPSTYVMATPFVRRQYLKALLSTAAAWGTVAGMSKLYGQATGSDVEVGTDMDSADFGKIRIGDTRIDPGGGFQQFLVAAHRLWSGGYTSSSTEKWHRFGEGYQAQTQESNMQRFFVNKLNPTTKFAYDLLSASQYNPFHVGDRTAQMFIPLLVQDLNELRKEAPELGLGTALGVGGAAALGMGTQTYEKGESVGKIIPPEYDWQIEGGGLSDLFGGD